MWVIGGGVSRGTNGDASRDGLIREEMGRGEGMVSEDGQGTGRQGEAFTSES